jgi:hypothetical protein
MRTRDGQSRIMFGFSFSTFLFLHRAASHRHTITRMLAHPRQLVPLQLPTTKPVGICAIKKGTRESTIQQWILSYSMTTDSRRTMEATPRWSKKATMSMHMRKSYCLVFSVFGKWSVFCFRFLLALVLPHVCIASGCWLSGLFLHFSHPGCRRTKKQPAPKSEWRSENSNSKEVLS